MARVEGSLEWTCIQYFLKRNGKKKSISAQCRMWPFSSSCVHVASVISDNFHLAFCIRKGNPQYRSMRKAGERGGAELRWALSSLAATCSVRECARMTGARGGARVMLGLDVAEGAGSLMRDGTMWR